ncbi:MAG: isoprenylcysteine carboxylmethyltransferase family protein [Acidobacteria bacterium]|nr:isoprenylcysteine carboxylmethyltransferase family protein [Acidobacteriota bacterium]
MSWAKVARWRVPLGFAAFLAAFVFATPTRTTLLAGAAVALMGQLLRVWAAGHIEKGREVTRSGPYHYLRHPLYVGSLLMGAGFVIASASLWTGVLAVAYFTVTYVAAVRSEEATLDARFAGEYSAYKEGRATAASAPATRRFSLQRAFGMNKELRSVAGLAAAFALLVWRTFT